MMYRAQKNEIHQHSPTLVVNVGADSFADEGTMQRSDRSMTEGPAE